MPSSRAVVVPAWNEEETIARIVRGAIRWGDVIVVDDGSTDRTAARAEAAGAFVIRLPRNCGKGAALRAGWAEAARRGCAAVATLDADGQHDPEDLAPLWSAYERTGADLVIGVRARRTPMPVVRQWANGLAAALVAMATARRILDAQCGARVFRTACLQRLRLRTRGFAIEVEVLVRFLRAGYSVVEVPVPARYHGRRSRVQPFRVLPSTMLAVLAGAWA